MLDATPNVSRSLRLGERVFLVMFLPNGVGTVTGTQIFSPGNACASVVRTGVGLFDVTWNVGVGADIASYKFNTSSFAIDVWASHRSNSARNVVLGGISFNASGQLVTPISMLNSAGAGADDGPASHIVTTVRVALDDTRNV